MTFSFDRLVITALTIGLVALGARAWLHEHPQHDPWAPLTLTDPAGWATDLKFAGLRDDREVCRAFLDRSGIEAATLPPVGKGACRREDRQVLVALQHGGVALAPRSAEATCAIDAGLAWWLRHGVQPAAESILNSRVIRLEHFGTANCRRIGDGSEGSWSEHARGNAIDIGGFVLADGRRIDLRHDWQGEDEAATFLHAVRDRACRSFATVLSPDYNDAHGDHLHLDQATRGGGWNACR